MSEDKPIQSNYMQVLGKGYCKKHNCQNHADLNSGEEWCPMCSRGESNVTWTSEPAQPSPPTPRPDVEELQKEAEINVLDPTNGPGYRNQLSLCDYALDVEKRLKEQIDKRLEQQDRRAETIAMCEHLQTRSKFADSLLADLVEAIEGMDWNDKGHNVLCRAHIDGNIGKCSCGRSEVAAALTAAKQHLESGEEGKKK